MYTVITVLLFITCILLILIVLVQNSKGGGLASNFQASNQIMGVRKTTDFLEKATWVLAGSLLFLSVIGTAFIDRGQKSSGSQMKEQIEKAVDPSQVPSFPAPTTDKSAAPATTTPSTAAPDSTK
jgi:preprotein translocase subunit SecG